MSWMEISVDQYTLLDPVKQKGTANDLGRTPIKVEIELEDNRTRYVL